MLLVIAIALPFYWLMEPGRQSNAATDFNARFVSAGSAMFAVTADGGFNCAGCHGPKGIGGSADYNLTLPDGTIQVVKWKAPALNTVLLRYDRSEVLFILTYGRPFSPMPAWGVLGGGPLNDQQPARTSWTTWRASSSRPNRRNREPATGSRPCSR